MLKPPWIINMEDHITLNLLPVLAMDVLFYWYQNKYYPLMCDVTMTSLSDHALENWDLVIFCVKYRQKLIFCVKSHGNMWLSFFWLNMLENDKSKLQTNFWLHISSNIFSTIKFLNNRIAVYPTPGVGGMFKISLMKRNDELRDNRSNSTPLLYVFEHRGENWTPPPPLEY